ncbi:MAG: hypothetical protein JWN70_4047, partial [Planctomycetaceae bacterium]|nr:hypothetical protein [Planctomycetaceae bacterium]
LGMFLWTHNPFYLISLALVLHSTRLWHHDSMEAFNPWPLMSIIGGYLLLVAVTGFLLIKLGRVWDDARSILLMILLLFLELTLLVDDILIRDVRTGTMLLCMGWSAAVLISECLLIGLRMRLPWTYRGPFHLLLALMFLYPLFLVSGTNDGHEMVWRIFWFSPCVAAALLCLLPAVHRGRGALAQNGTPWSWPLYPWALFGFLTICLGLRAWALTLSFDPVMGQGFDEAMQMQGIFGSYFLIPVVLALGILALEAGVVERRQVLILTGLIAPIVCLRMAVPVGGGSWPFLEFRAQFTERFGSPTWLMLNGCWLFYAYALCRGVKVAAVGMLGMAVTIMVCGRIWPHQGAAFGLPALPLLLTSGWVLLQGWRRGDSWYFVAGLLGACAAGRDMDPGLLIPLAREAVWWNLSCLGILLSGLLFQDRAAKYWKQVGSALLAVNCLLAAVLPNLVEVNLPYGSLLAYCVVATSIAAAYAWVTRLFECRSAAAACMVFAAARLMLDSADLLKRSFHWDGALYFVVGLGAFVVAVVISAIKSARSSLTPPAVPAGDVVSPIT